jgi:hypothetical protein
MNIQVSAGADGLSVSSESASAALDPLFTVDLPLDLSGQYQMFFSDGVGNGANGVTPIPAALPLFATGLGALGLLAWRSRRKVLAA